MYLLRNFASSIKKNFDPNLYFGGEGLAIALPLIATGSGVYVAATETLKASQQVLPKIGLYGGAAVAITGAVFFCG